MIARRITLLILAAAVMAASAGVVVVSAAFALYTWLDGYLGPVGASAVIAAGFAVIFAVAGLILLRRGGAGRKAAKPPRASSPVNRLVDTLRERPVIAAGAATAAGLLAWRNPQLVALILRAFERRQDDA